MDSVIQEKKMIHIDKKATNDVITLKNRQTIRIGDKIKAKVRMSGVRLISVGEVLEIFPDKKYFKVRTRDGITLFSFYEVMIVGDDRG